MGFLTSGLFWGFILILIGLSIIVRVLFNIDVPVFKVVFGLILLYLGFQVLFGPAVRSGRHSRARSRVEVRVDRSTKAQETDFDETSQVHPDRENEYNIVFGGGTIDLTDLSRIPEDHRITINVVFGSALVLLDPQMTVTVKNSTVFGESILPGKTVSFFGDDEFRFGNNGGYDIYIETNTVFGSLEMKVVEK